MYGGSLWIRCERQMTSDTPPGDPSRQANADRDSDRTPDPEGIDRRLRLLADRDRRLLVSQLLTDDEPVRLEALATVLTDGRAPPLDHETALSVLHHEHLPRLDREGIVSYDPTDRSVVYNGDALLEECLRALSEADGGPSRFEE